MITTLILSTIALTTVFLGEGDEKTLFFEPTILCDVSQEMSVVREEVISVSPCA